MYDVSISRRTLGDLISQIVWQYIRWSLKSHDFDFAIYTANVASATVLPVSGLLAYVDLAAVLFDGTACMQFLTGGRASITARNGPCAAQLTTCWVRAFHCIVLFILFIL